MNLHAWMAQAEDGSWQVRHLCLQVMSCVRDDMKLQNCQPSQESCHMDTLTVPGLNAFVSAQADMPRHLLQSTSFKMGQRSLLRGDSQGCAISQPKCNLPGPA